MFYKCPICLGEKMLWWLGYFYIPTFFFSEPLKTPPCVHLYFTPQATEAYQSVFKSVDTHSTWLALVTDSQVPCKTTVDTSIYSVVFPLFLLSLTGSVLLTCLDHYCFFP